MLPALRLRRFEEILAGAACQVGSIAFWAPAIGVTISGLPGGPAATVADLIVDQPAVRDYGRHSCTILAFLSGQQGRKGRRWGGEGAATGCIQSYCVSIEADL